MDKPYAGPYAHVMNINNQSETLAKLKTLMVDTEFNDIEIAIAGKKVACHEAILVQNEFFLIVDQVTLRKGKCWCSTFVRGY